MGSSDSIRTGRPPIRGQTAGKLSWSEVQRINPLTRSFKALKRAVDVLSNALAVNFVK